MKRILIVFALVSFAIASCGPSDTDKDSTKGDSLKKLDKTEDVQIQKVEEGDTVNPLASSKDGFQKKVAPAETTSTTTKEVATDDKEGAITTTKKIKKEIKK